MSFYHLPCLIEVHSSLFTQANLEVNNNNRNVAYLAPLCFSNILKESIIPTFYLPRSRSCGSLSAAPICWDAAIGAALWAAACSFRAWEGSRTSGTSPPGCATPAGSGDGDDAVPRWMHHWHRNRADWRWRQPTTTCWHWLISQRAQKSHRPATYPAGHWLDSPGGNRSDSMTGQRH